MEKKKSYGVLIAGAILLILGIVLAVITHNNSYQESVAYGRFLQVANVGDSRLYVVGSKIRQITRDHSYVEEMVRIGELDRADARNHPDKNIITRAVGAEDKVEPDFFTVELQEGEIVLMCSDGLTNMLEDEEIRMIISGARDLVEKAESLVEAANANGGRDNISVILIEPCA